MAAAVVSLWPHRPAGLGAAPRQVRTRRAMPAAMAQKSEQEQVAAQTAEAAAAPEGQPRPSALSSYDAGDFGGYEAASVPRVAPGDLSEESEDEEAQEAARRNAAYLEQLRALAGAELAELEAQKP
ncbi:hypothetical protein ABPG75_010768 [Micractinium tetrahymenae]